MAEHSDVQADMMLEQEFNVLHLDPQVTELDCVPHRVQLEHKKPQSPPHSDILPPTRPHFLMVPHPRAKHWSTWIYRGHSYSPNLKSGKGGVWAQYCTLREWGQVEGFLGDCLHIFQRPLEQDPSPTWSVSGLFPVHFTAWLLCHLLCPLSIPL